MRERLEERQKELRSQQLQIPLRRSDSSAYDLLDLHKRVRQQAAHSRKRMKKKYSRQHHVTEFNIGDVVLFRIPKKLQRSTKVSRIPGRIHKIRNHGYFKRLMMLALI